MNIDLSEVLHGMNAERCLLAGEALGLGYVALEKAAKYAKERVIFGRPIGQNQGIQAVVLGPGYTVALRKVDGALPIRLGDGSAGGLSPDGKWAISISVGNPKQVTLLPTGQSLPSRRDGSRLRIQVPEPVLATLPFRQAYVLKLSGAH